jgi:hypothetical protein
VSFDENSGVCFDACSGLSFGVSLAAWSSCVPGSVVGEVTRKSSTRKRSRTCIVTRAARLAAREIGARLLPIRPGVAAGSIQIFGATFGKLDAAAKPSSSNGWKLATTSRMAYRRFPGRQGPDNVRDASASRSWLKTIQELCHRGRPANLLNRLSIALRQ